MKPVPDMALVMGCNCIVKHGRQCRRQILCEKYTIDFDFKQSQLQLSAGLEKEAATYVHPRITNRPTQ